MIVKLILGLLWCLIHLVISLFDIWSYLSNNLECYLILSELLPKYLNERLKYLGVVVDSREAYNILKVKQLLWWISTIGVKYVVVYDIEGVLKELLEPGIETSRDENSRNSLISDCDFHGYDRSDIVFPEIDMACARRAVGSRGPEFDFLVYGSVRCHFGFPAWRLRYIEIVYVRANTYLKKAHLICKTGTYGTG